MPAASAFGKTRDALSRARARLEDMNVQEVSLVDNAANLRKLVVTKRDETMAKSVLPPTAKQSMLDGLAQALDKMSSLATVISEAEVAEDAPVPPELAKAIAQCGELLHGMAKQFLPPADGEAAEKALPGAQKAPTDLGSKQKDSMSLGTKQKKDAEEESEVEKAGKKMAGARYAKLVDARTKAAEHLASLDALIAEVSDASAAPAAPGAAPALEAEKAAKKPPFPPKGDAADGEDDEEDMPAKGKSKKTVEGETVETLANKVAELTAKLEKVTKAAPAPAEAPEGNSQPLDGSPVEKGAHKWPLDLSAHVAAKRAAAKRG